MNDSLNELMQIIPPSPWVENWCRQIAPGRRVLDLACGNGRHARYLAALGYEVLAVDQNETAIAGLCNITGVTALQLDLEANEWPLGGRSFAGIVVTNYLWRPRLPDVLAMLDTGGVLIYETFMQGNEAYGKPSRPDFLLRPGELRELAKGAGLREIAFVEGYVDTPKPAMCQAICALRE